MIAVELDLSPALPIPTQVLRTDTLPRSPSGKLDKLTIRAWAHDQLRR